MENSSGLTYLAVAYGVFFILLALYLARLARRQQELQAAVEELEARVRSARKSP